MDRTPDETGPIDYIVLEWPGRQPSGEIAPMLVDLVDRGLIGILDVAFLAKDEDGSVATVETGAFEEDDPALALLGGAATGLLGPDDLEEAAMALEPGTCAAVLVWENRWAAPFASAVRRSGGELVAAGRIPVQALLASLDAAEAVH
jgi:hypothetical protein